MSTQDVDWDRLDKRKFFVVGLGLFSGVTTCLYPLSVIKTRQMASSHTSPGIAGAWQTARTMARTDGKPGFYRGFATAVLATIPVRMVYMSALEMTKTATAKLGAKLDLAPTTQATAANFAGGAAASLTSQCLVVPIDVVTQRMMVHGMATQGGHGTSAGAAASSSAASSTAAQASAAMSTQAAAAAPQASSSTQAAAAAAGRSRGLAAGVEASQTAQHRRFSSLASSSGRGFSRLVLPTASPLHASGVCNGSSSSSGSSSSGSSGGSSSSISSSSALAARASDQRRCSTSATSSSSAGARTVHMSGPQMARLIIQQEGLGGLYRGFIPSITTYVPSSAVWWGMYALYQRLLTAQLHPSSESAVPQTSTGEAVAVQTSAAILSGLTTGFLITPLDLIKTRMQVASLDAQGRQPTWSGTLRAVLAEPPGLKGLFRGAAPRMMSSCLWGTAMLTSYETLVRISVKAVGAQ